MDPHLRTANPSDGDDGDDGDGCNGQIHTVGSAGRLLPKIVMPIVYWTWMGLHEEAPKEEATIVDGWRRIACSPRFLLPRTPVLPLDYTHAPRQFLPPNIHEDRLSSCSATPTDARLMKSTARGESAVDHRVERTPGRSSFEVCTRKKSTLGKTVGDRSPHQARNHTTDQRSLSKRTRSGGGPERSVCMFSWTLAPNRGAAESVALLHPASITAVWIANRDRIVCNSIPMNASFGRSTIAIHFS